MIKELTELMNEKGLSQTQVARAIGKSPAVINQYLKNKYKGDVNGLESDICNFISRETDRRKNKNIVASFVMTETAKRGLNVIRLAHMDSDINVVYGDAGLGKTMILREYASQHSDVILIETDPGYTARTVLEELCAKLGINRRGNMHELSEACINALDGSGRLLLIDEAENLPYRALETIRRLHDKSGVGVVLAGMPRLLLNLKGKRGEYKQLYSRVGLALPIGDVLPRQDIHDIAVNLMPDAGAVDVSETLYKVSRGNARRLFKLIRGVNRHVKISGDVVTPDVVTEFSKMLIN
ncbi:AAA family ATPase [Citrobacter braakii]|uniref:AAA family ATPase n=1 Tax=Citrobacter braakii TaxID=57706 RepID=UPI003523F593